jgi:hypothetical protein
LSVGVFPSPLNIIFGILSNFFRINQLIFGLILILTLSWGLLIKPSIAQDNTRAKVVLDGYPLFTVHNSGIYTAEQRSSEANKLLEKTVNYGDFILIISIY